MGESLHIVVCPSAGMGHLLPFLRVSSMLSSLNCKVTLMTIHPTLSTSETVHISSFLTTRPHITPLNTQLPSLETPLITNNAGKTTDPKATPDLFFLRYTAISNSAHLLARHLIELSPPPTAILCDFMFLKGFHQTLSHLDIPIYVLPITSSKFFTLTAYISYPGTPFNKNVENENENELVISPCMAPIPKSFVPPPYFNPNHIYTKLVVSNSYWLHKCKGIVLYSFDFLEHETLSALKSNALSYLPPNVFAIGPLKPLDDVKTNVVAVENAEKCDFSYFAWLDEQPAKSVVYVNFGSRTAMTKEQIVELGAGLELSGVRYMWVVKTTEVDNQDKEELGSLLGESFVDKTSKFKKGLVLKQWVDQDRVLVHPSVGAFVTHSGWNSVTEAAQCGNPVLAWPLHGDQKLNAEVMEKVGLGIWESGWGWIGERLVKKEEIAEKVKEVMMNKGLRESAKRVGEEASKAWDSNGTSSLMMTRFIQDIMSSNSLVSKNVYQN